MNKSFILLCVFFICLKSSSSIKILDYQNYGAYVTTNWTQIIEFDFSKVPDDIKGDGGHRMQNFVVSGDYIYTCIRYKGASGTHSDNAILKFKYPSSGKVANYTGEVMRVLNAGHGETMAMYNGYLIMGLKAKNGSGKETDNYFSTQIGIFKFQPGKELNYTKITRISHVNEAKMENGKTVDMGTPNRVLAAVSGNLLTMRITIEGKGYQWTTYDLSKIEGFIKEQSGDHKPCGEINSISGAYKYSFNSGSDKKTGYESFQGMESYGDNLYVSSGQGGIDGLVEPARITVFNRMTGKMGEGYQLKGGNISVKGVSYAIKNVETQGLHQQSGNMFVLLDQTKTKIGIVRFKI